MLGLISTTRQGAELLEELGWIATRTATGKTTGICLPMTSPTLSEYVSQTAPGECLLMLRADRAVAPPRDASHDRASAGFDRLGGGDHDCNCNLSNYVLAAGAMSNLKRYVCVVKGSSST